MFGREYHRVSLGYSRDEIMKKLEKLSKKGYKVHCVVDEYMLLSRSWFRKIFG